MSRGFQPQYNNNYDDWDDSHDEYGLAAEMRGGQPQPVAHVTEDGQKILPETEFEPTQEDVDEYAKWLGMDLEADRDLLWIAVEGLKAPLPPGWKACETAEGEMYYFNFDTGESSWDHPLDTFYKDKFKEEKAKLQRRRAQGGSSSSSTLGPPTLPGQKRIPEPAGLSSILSPQPAQKGGATYGAKLGPLGGDKEPSPDWDEVRLSPQGKGEAQKPNLGLALKPLGPSGGSGNLGEAKAQIKKEFDDELERYKREQEKRVEFLKREFDNGDEERKGLEERVDRLHKELDSLRSSVQSAESERSSLASSLQQLQQQAEEAAAQRRDAESQLKEARAGLAQAVQDRDQARREREAAEEEVRQAREAKARGDREAAGLRSEGESLQREVGSLQGRVADLKRSLEGLRGEREDLERAEGELRGRLEGLRPTVARLRTEAEGLEGDRARLQEQQRSLESSVAELRSSVERLEDVRRSLASQESQQAALQERAAELGAVRERLEGLHRDLDQLRAQERGLGEEKAGLEGRVRSLGAEVERARAEASALAAELEELRASVRRGEEERRDLGARGEGLQSSLEALRRDAAEVESQGQRKRELEGQLASLRSEVTQLTADVAQMRERRDEGRLSLEHAVQELERKFDRDLADLRERNQARLRAEEDRLGGEFSAEKLRLTQAHNQRLASLRQALEREEEEASRRARSEAGAASSSHATLADLERKVALKRAEVAQLEGQIADLQAQLASLQSRVDSARREGAVVGAAGSRKGAEKGGRWAEPVGPEGEEEVDVSLREIAGGTAPGGGAWNIPLPRTMVSETESEAGWAAAAEAAGASKKMESFLKGQKRLLRERMEAVERARRDWAADYRALEAEQDPYERARRHQLLSEVKGLLESQAIRLNDEARALKEFKGRLQQGKGATVGGVARGGPRYPESSLQTPAKGLSRTGGANAEVLYAVQESLQRINQALMGSGALPAASLLSPLGKTGGFHDPYADTHATLIPPSPGQALFNASSRWQSEAEVSKQLLSGHAEWMRSFQRELDKFRGMLTMGSSSTSSPPRNSRTVARTYRP